MLLKLIECEVPEASRERFAIAQEAWSALAPLPGFLLQIGGWGTEHPTMATIFALWVSRAAYEGFMREHHDAIARGSAQDSTYEAIRVTTGEFDDPGGFDALLSVARSTSAAEPVAHQRFQFQMSDPALAGSLRLVREWTVLSESLASQPLADERARA